MSIPSIQLLGDLMVDIAYDVGDLAALCAARGSDLPTAATLSPGGSAANTATWLARAGNNVHLIGAVGVDPMGDYLINAIGSTGVQMSVQRVPDESTGICLIFNEENGQRTMIPSAGANARFDNTQLIIHLAESKVSHLHVSAYILFHELSGTTALAYMDAARKVGASISLDPASYALLKHHRARLLQAMAMSDLLLANADEALEITRILSTNASSPHATSSGEIPPDNIDLDLISAAMHPLSPTVVVTDGIKPVRALTDRVHNFTSPVAGIDSVVSTTGAGDAFNAGYLNAWLAGGDVPASLSAGTILAGRVLSEIGATTLTTKPALR